MHLGDELNFRLKHGYFAQKKLRDMVVSNGFQLRDMVVANGFLAFYNYPSTRLRYESVL